MKIHCLLTAVCGWALVSGAVAAAKPPPGAPVNLQAALPAPSEADWRTPDPQNVLVIDTNKGRILFELSPPVAPKSVERVRDLTRQGLYDGRTFFRVIDNFMDQTGDPLDTGAGGSKLPDLAAEFTFRRGEDAAMAVVSTDNGVEAGFVGATPVVSQPMMLGAMLADHRVRAYGAFCPGVGGMARAGDPNSGNSQFFLMRAGNASLDQQYTVFGRVLAGMDVVRAIKTGEPVVAPQDKMLKVRVLADLPATERPKLRVIDTNGAWFQASVARTHAQTGVSPQICDIDIPVQLK